MKMSSPNDKATALEVLEGILEISGHVKMVVKRTQENEKEAPPMIKVTALEAPASVKRAQENNLEDNSAETEPASVKRAWEGNLLRTYKSNVKGKRTFSNGSTFEGEFKDSKCNGQPRWRRPQGRVQEQQEERPGQVHKLRWRRP